MSKLLLGLVGLLALLVQACIEIATVAVFIYGICLVFNIAFTLNIVLGAWLMLTAGTAIIKDKIK